MILSISYSHNLHALLGNKLRLIASILSIFFLILLLPFQKYTFLPSGMILSEKILFLVTYRYSLATYLTCEVSFQSLLYGFMCLFITCTVTQEAVGTLVLYHWGSVFYVGMFHSTYHRERLTEVSPSRGSVACGLKACVSCPRRQD